MAARNSQFLLASNALFTRGVGQKIAGQLLDGKLIERHTRVERVDHPIPIRPDVALAVLLVAVGIGVAR